MLGWEVWATSAPVRCWPGAASCPGWGPGNAQLQVLLCEGSFPPLHLPTSLRSRKIPVPVLFVDGQLILLAGLTGLFAKGQQSAPKRRLRGRISSPPQTSFLSSRPGFLSPSVPWHPCAWHAKRQVFVCPRSCSSPWAWPLNWGQGGLWAVREAGSSSCPEFTSWECLGALSPTHCTWIQCQPLVQSLPFTPG